MLGTLTRSKLSCLMAQLHTSLLRQHGRHMTGKIQEPLRCVTRDLSELPSVSQPQTGTWMAALTNRVKANRPASWSHAAVLAYGRPDLKHLVHLKEITAGALLDQAARPCTGLHGSCWDDAWTAIVPRIVRSFDCTESLDYGHVHAARVS